MSEVDPAKEIISREEWQAAEQYLARWRAVEADLQNASLLEALLKASPKVKSFQIIGNDPIDYGNFLLKVHCELTFGRTFQIRFRGVAGHTFRLLLRIYTDKLLLTALGQRHLFFQSHELSAPLPQ